MDFNELYAVVEALQEFSVYKYKLANRKLETESLKPYFQKLPERLQVFSFPYQYAFEENLIKSYKKPLSIWSCEKLNINDTSETWLNAKRFLKKNPNCEVYLPSRVMFGRVYPLNRTDRSLSLTNVLNGYTKMGKVDFSAWHVQQKLYDLPDSFDVFDLDYVRSLDIENFNWNKLAWSKLKQGGLLYTTFTLSAYRTFDIAVSKFRDKVDQETLDKFKRENVIQEPKTKYITVEPNNFKQFGLGNEKLYETYENMVNNYIDLHYGIFDTTPAYVNIYRGGEAEGNRGAIMCRIVWVKGEADIDELKLTGTEIQEIEKRGSENLPEPEELPKEPKLGAINIKREWKSKKTINLPKDEIFDLYYNKKLPATKIAPLYNVSFSTILDFITKHGGVLRTRTEIYEPFRIKLPKDEIFDLYYNKKIPGTEIAKKYNTTGNAVYAFIRRHGGHIRPKHGTFKHDLNKDEIFDLYYNKKISTPKIAKMFNVSSDVILSFIKRHGGKIRSYEEHREPLRVNIPKDELFDLYYNKRIPTRVIAKKYNTTISTILSNIKKFGGEVTSSSIQPSQIPKEKLFDLYYNQKISARKIADIFNVSLPIIYKFIKKYGGEVDRRLKSITKKD